MQAVVRYEPEQVEEALARLGLELPILLEAVQAGYVSRISRTANDAPNAGGFYQWNDTLRSLRENSAARGWKRDDSGNWPTIVHPENLLAVAVSSGNESVGNPRATPSTGRPKGSRTAHAVEVNAAQGWLPGFEPQTAEPTAERPTWLLMYFASRDELRAELSLPVSMDIEGRVVAWRERIILPKISLDPDAVVNAPAPDFGPDIEINIAKKA